MLPSMLPPSDAIPDCEHPFQTFLVYSPHSSSNNNPRPDRRRREQRKTYGSPPASPLVLSSSLFMPYLSLGLPFASAHWTVCH